MSRIENSIKNIYSNIIVKILTLVISFIARAVFISIFTQDYLGISGLFSNILTLLSLAELGVGTAIVFSMYKPLAQNESEKIRTLMDLYRKIYFCIGVVVTVIGICLVPFLDTIIGTHDITENLALIYLLYLFNTSISYFLGYMQALISADQKMYIITKYTGTFDVVIAILQILVLCITRNYMLYLITQIIFKLILNILLYKKGLALYPFLKSKDKVQPLNTEDKRIIIKNIKAMLFHKIGGVAVFATDNLIITTFISLAMVGIYSNYLIIITNITSWFRIFFSSISASVGNYVADKSKSESLDLFWKTEFIGFSMVLFSSVCLINLLNPFIGDIWIRQESYLLSQSVVLAIVISFFITNMRVNIEVYKSVMGIFAPDKYKPLVEAIVNLSVSIFLVNRIGFIGVILGTIFSSLFVCMTVEPYILFKHGFSTSCRIYYKKTIYKYIVAALVIALSIYINGFITDTSIISFILKGCVSVCISIVGIIIFFFKTNEFQYLIHHIKKWLSIY